MKLQQSIPTPGRGRDHGNPAKRQERTTDLFRANFGRPFFAKVQRKEERHFTDQKLMSRFLKEMSEDIIFNVLGPLDISDGTDTIVCPRCENEISFNPILLYNTIYNLERGSQTRVHCPNCEELLIARSVFYSFPKDIWYSYIGNRDPLSIADYMTVSFSIAGERFRFPWETGEGMVVGDIQERKMRGRPVLGRVTREDIVKFVNGEAAFEDERTMSRYSYLPTHRDNFLVWGNGHGDKQEIIKTCLLRMSMGRDEIELFAAHRTPKHMIEYTHNKKANVRGLYMCDPEKKSFQMSVVPTKAYKTFEVWEELP